MAARPPGRRSEPARPSMAVISWDVGHNPLGRANVLAEVLARRFDVAAETRPDVASVYQATMARLGKKKD